jgi:pimeloyl-ACP methyl ester carboxylesterase
VLNPRNSRLALAMAAVPVMIAMRSPLHAQDTRFAAQDSSRVVPRFEPGPCPGEPRSLPEGLKLECGRLVVSERRDQSSERTVRLPVAILRGPERSALPPLVLIHGGPGESGLESFLPVVAASPLPRMRDVVMFDQRGAGHAEPALCPDFNGRRGEALLAADSGGTASERERAVVRSCVASLRRQEIDPTAYTTAESASDVVDLRKALGYATWDVYAVSYGGRLAWLPWRWMRRASARRCWSGR